MSVSIRNLTVLRVLRTVEQRGLAILQIMLYFSWPVVCTQSGSSQLLNTSYVEALRLASWRTSWRFFAHARMLDCTLLPLSVTWVPTMSVPCKCWVLPDGSLSSSFGIKRLWQYMILHNSWNAPGTFSESMMCSSSLSSCPRSFLSLQSGNTF